MFLYLSSKAKASQAKILLPETADERVLQAAIIAAKQNVAKIVLLGKKEKFVGVMPNKYLAAFEFIDPKNKELQMKYASLLYNLRKEKGMTIDEAMQKISNPLYFSTLALKSGDVDGIVAGAVSHTADVLRPAFQIIKAKPGTEVVSSIFAMETKSAEFGENGLLILGDCGVIENPDENQLASIAIESAKTAKEVFGFSEPKVAMLSYSTKSTSENVSDQIKKVKDAFLLVRRKDSSLAVDGELQVDSALVPSVAELKCPHSKLKGRANVLIFPDLNSGNIAYKLAARISGAKTVGPILQGLNKPVNDVSRGATAEEIFLAICVTAIQADANKNK